MTKRSNSASGAKPSPTSKKRRTTSAATEPAHTGHAPAPEAAGVGDAAVSSVTHPAEAHVAAHGSHQPGRTKPTWEPVEHDAASEAEPAAIPRSTKLRATGVKQRATAAPANVAMGPKSKSRSKPKRGPSTIPPAEVAHDAGDVVGAEVPHVVLSEDAPDATNSSGEDLGAPVATAEAPLDPPIGSAASSSGSTTASESAAEPTTAPVATTSKRKRRGATTGTSAAAPAAEPAPQSPPRLSPPWRRSLPSSAP